MLHQQQASIELTSRITMMECSSSQHILPLKAECMLHMRRGKKSKQVQKFVEILKFSH